MIFSSAGLRTRARRERLGEGEPGEGAAMAKGQIDVEAGGSESGSYVDIHAGDFLQKNGSDPLIVENLRNPLRRESQGKATSVEKVENCVHERREREMAKASDAETIAGEFLYEEGSGRLIPARARRKRYRKSVQWWKFAFMKKEKGNSERERYKSIC